MKKWLVIIAALLAGCSGGQSPTDGGSCKPGEQTCKYYFDCPTDQDCQEGCCRAAAHCSSDSICQPDGLCVDGRCVELCGTDLDCPAEASCHFGFCVPYPADVLQALTTPAPDEQSAGSKQPLKVGIGDVALDFPVGVSMWGFGARLGPDTPYSGTLNGSDSFFDRPRCKAFAFDNGVRRIILVRTPMGASVDFMSSQVAWQIYQARGENYLNRLVYSAHHSHSHPASFWNIFPEGVKLGVLGTGEFNYEIFRRLSDNISQAVMAAIDDLKPARFGYAIDDHMDPEGLVHEYRRGESPQLEQYMDDHLVVMRIDDADGNLRAVLVNLALHGTHFDATTVSMDSPGGVELIAQNNLQKLTGRPVVVAFLSRCSGDVSPAGDGTGLDDWRKVQEVGEQAWPKVKALVDSLEGKTTGDVDLDIFSSRIPEDREHLGYGPEEFYEQKVGTSCSDDSDCSSQQVCIDDACGALYRYGAFQCVMGGDEDPDTHFEDGHLGCIFSAQTLAKGRPIPQFGKARMSALKLGGLTLATVPGEPCADYCRDLEAEMKSQGFGDITILGYSQDHHLYIMEADNWLQGGYEPSMGIWGWKEGDYFLERTAELLGWLKGRGSGNEEGGIKPEYFEFSCQSNADCGNDNLGKPMACGAGGYCVVPPTASQDAGTVLQDAPETLERLEQVRLRFSGGHPAADLPRMTLEKDQGGQWVKVTNPAGVEYSDDGYTTITWYRGDYENDHTWEIWWEEKIDFPTGVYRIHIDGHWFDGNTVREYQANSRAFELRPSSRLKLLQISFTQDTLSGAALYPPGPTNDDGHSAFSRLEPAGVLHHSGRAPPTMPWPPPTDGSLLVTGTVLAPGPETVTLAAIPVAAEGTAQYSYVSSRDAQGAESVQSAQLSAGLFSAAHGANRGAGGYTLDLRVEDAYGNFGTAQVQVDLP